MTAFRRLTAWLSNMLWFDLGFLAGVIVGGLYVGTLVALKMNGAIL